MQAGIHFALRVGILALALCSGGSASALDDLPACVQPMRDVHARFTGTPGTLALLGDSITVSLAFWAPLTLPALTFDVFLSARHFATPYASTTCKNRPRST